jgi:uncharacterized protein YdhG (YjbR/CyaY superfamily)
MNTKKPTTIEEYIAQAPKAAQPKLREILEILRTAAPGAKENLKWNQPALSYDWILFQFAAFKNFISLYPTPSIVKKLKKELGDYAASTMTIKFALDKPLPKTLIAKIAKERVKEAKNGVKWM